MKLHPGLSRAGIELVKQYEGLRRSAGRLADGRWTIGYGHTVSAREGAVVTADEADALLTYDLNRVAQALDGIVFTPLNVNQFNAVVAFAFNIGLENFRRSEVLKRINEGALLQAAAALELWRRADLQGGSLVVDALVRRRAAEKALFLTPPDGVRPVPTPVVRPQFDPALGDLAPLLPGLANAADITVSLDGENAVAAFEAEPPPFEPSPAAIAAQRVSERLNRLFPDEAKPSAPAEVVGPTADLAMPEGPEPPPVIETPLAPPVFEPPPPSLFAPPPPRTSVPPPPRSFDEPEDAGGPFGRRYPTLAERAATANRPQPPPTAPAQNLAVLALGVFGAALFCGALATMVFGRATLVNLALGLLGVVCMAPSALHLLTQLLSDRSGGAAED